VVNREEPELEAQFVISAPAPQLRLRNTGKRDSVKKDEAKIRIFEW
jgi:hypothetical protein